MPQVLQEDYRTSVQDKLSAGQSKQDLIDNLMTSAAKGKKDKKQKGSSLSHQLRMRLRMRLKSIKKEATKKAKMLQQMH